eukprot:GHVR01176273.1.p1 GENE.GHVR01176273.1~~GHVR01176273.1.p1  ORF type:complete len:280 (+),score=52.76 GHVR01176273.1:69-908(+)
MMLTGHVAVVTGASKGIGKHIALELGKMGAFVTLAARNLDLLTQVKTEIESYGSKAIAVLADVTNSKDIDNIFTETHKAFGPATIVVNNAGVLFPNPLMQADKSSLGRYWDTNVVPVVIASQHAMRHFEEHLQKGIFSGCMWVFNMSSAASIPLRQIGDERSLGYDISKTAVNAITYNFAGYANTVNRKQGEERVRVVGIAPYCFDTDMVSSLAASKGMSSTEMSTKLNPCQKLGDTDVIGKVLVRVVLRQLKWMNGQIFTVDGDETIEPIQANYFPTV